MNVLQDLLKLLNLIELKPNHYLGHSQDLGFLHLFGGQVIAQALSAAARTVSDQYLSHSLHCYFLRPGDAKSPITYVVECTRDGRSFATRRVSAAQGSKPILIMDTSFHLIEAGFDHSAVMPNVPGPEGLKSELDLMREIKEQIPEPLRTKFTCDRPIEIRPVKIYDRLEPKAMPPEKFLWLKASGAMPESQAWQQFVLAYTSDFSLISTSLLPHSINVFNPKLQVASIDHAMWFHRPFRMDEWLLYHVKSPSAFGGRGFNAGSIFDQKGHLVATVAQEGLIRIKPA